MTKFEVKEPWRSKVIVCRNITSTEFLTCTHSLLQFHGMLWSKHVCSNSPVYAQLLFTTFIKQLVRAIDQDVINVDIHWETNEWSQCTEYNKNTTAVIPCVFMFLWWKQVPNLKSRPPVRPLSRYLTISSQAGNKPSTAVKKIRKRLLNLFKKER